MCREIAEPVGPHRDDQGPAGSRVEEVGDEARLLLGIGAEGEELLELVDDEGRIRPARR